MCKYSQKVAIELGFEAMQFNSVVSTNTIAVALWKSLGFDIVGTIPRAYKHSSLGYIDSFVMYKG
ncbi:GCN5-related N-acetyltransferase [Vibrio maritimus]|uniref:GCN5-related N-acetyltransferase n=1 Tax=Vibrio maritimus TaxID=990268 RepID=A0A090RX74_9VIBR|nr:GCN5-related N-acetyltransferase [Vibrio maritimus]